MTKREAKLPKRVTETVVRKHKAADEEFVASKFGLCLKKIRTDQGLTQRELAGRLGYRGIRYVSQMETGKHVPSLYTVTLLADVLHIKTSDLVSVLD